MMEVIFFSIFFVILSGAFFYDKRLHLIYLKKIKEAKFQKELSIVRYSKWQMFFVVGSVLLYCLFLWALGEVTVYTAYTGIVLLLLGMIAAFDYRTTLIPDRYTLAILFCTLIYGVYFFYINGNTLYLNAYLGVLAANLFVVFILFIIRMIKPSFFIGMGDIKLFFAISFFGFPASEFNMGYFLIVMGVVSLFLMKSICHIRKPRHNQNYLPMGVSIYLTYTLMLTFNQFIPIAMLQL